MSPLRRLFGRLAGSGPGTAQRARLDREVREEMSAHLEMRIREYIATGMDPVAARRVAERRFGDLDELARRGSETKLDARDPTPLGAFPSRRRGGNPERINPMSDFVSDLRYGVRMMAKSPGFTVVAVLSLALGIGFNTTLFTVIDAVLFKPMAVADPETLVRVIRVNGGDADLGGIGSMLQSYPDYVDIREGVEAFEAAGSYRTQMTTFNNEGQAEFVFGETASSNLFDVLGLPPLIGRTFAPDEEIPGNHSVVMVAEEFWRTRLEADPAALGRELLFGGNPYTLIGVVPDRYRGGTPPLAMSFWVPAPADDVLTPTSGRSRLERRSARSTYVVARLRSDVGIDEARAEIAALGENLAAEYGDTNEDVAFGLLPAADVRIDPTADRMLVPAAGVLMAIVGLILAIACANVANMMLARASVRRQEIAVRLALGAGRWRLIRQLLTESALVAGLGGAIAVAVAAWTLRVLTAIQPPVMVPISFDIGIDARVLVFTGFVSVATGLLFGLIPALQSTRTDLSASMRAEEAHQGRRPSKLRNTLVVGQVAVSLVLLVAASLLIRSLRNAESIETGIATDSVVGVSLGLVFQGYSGDEITAFNTAYMERVEALPGVEAVAFAERLPLDSTVHITSRVWIEDAPPEDADESTSVMSATVTPAYFQVMSIPIIAGRGFDAADTAESPLVAIINEVMAERFWPGQNPLGKRFSLQAPDSLQPPDAGGDGTPRQFVEVVGVNAPHKLKTLGEEPAPHLYVPYEQNPATGLGTVIARTRGDSARTLEAMRREVADLDSSVAIMEAETIGQHLSLSLFPVRLAAVSLLILGGLGALLAAVGVYGVVAFAVARRTREIGIRMAIGADRGGVVRMVVRQGMRLVGIGAAIGLAASVLSSRVLSSVLYGISATDVIAFAAALLGLAAIAVVANVLPALRASRVDPVTALRTE